MNNFCPSKDTLRFMNPLCLNCHFARNGNYQDFQSSYIISSTVNAKLYTALLQNFTLSKRWKTWHILTKSNT